MCECVLPSFGDMWRVLAVGPLEPGTCQYRRYRCETPTVVRRKANVHPFALHKLNGHFESPQEEPPHTYWQKQKKNVEFTYIFFRV